MSPPVRSKDAADDTLPGSSSSLPLRAIFCQLRTLKASAIGAWIFPVISTVLRQLFAIVPDSGKKKFESMEKGEEES
jgi:hypothetical protein